MPSKQLHNEVLAGGCETAKHHGPKGRNDLQINRKNKFPGERNVPSKILLEIFSYPAIVLESSLILLSSFFETAETAKHHLISCRKWRKINCKNKFPGGRNVPSEIVLEILSNPAIHKATAAAGLQIVPLATPKHHATEGRNDFQKKRCPGAWRPLWILLKTKQLLLQASKTYPRHTETPCHWRTERLSKTRCLGLDVPCGSC